MCDCDIYIYVMEGVRPEWWSVKVITARSETWEAVHVNGVLVSDTSTGVIRCGVEIAGKLT